MALLYSSNGSALGIGEGFEGVVLAARSGAEWAWTRIYQDISPLILGYLRAHRIPEPEDLTAEVFLQMVKSLANFEGDETAFRSWVFVIARNKVIDQARHSKRRPVDPTEDDTLQSHAQVGHVENEAIGNISREHVRGLIMDLSDDQRDVLLLRIFADLKIEEVAEIVGKNPGAIQGLQRRGLARIKKKISDETVSL